MAKLPLPCTTSPVVYTTPKCQRYVVAARGARVDGDPHRNAPLYSPGIPQPTLDPQLLAIPSRRQSLPAPGPGGAVDSPLRPGSLCVMDARGEGSGTHTLFPGGDYLPGTRLQA